MSTPDLTALAEELAAHGMTGHETAIAAVVRAARTAGLSPVLADVLADPRQPEVARVRAFGMLTSRLAGHQRATNAPVKVRRPEPALAA